MSSHAVPAPAAPPRCHARSHAAHGVAVAACSRSPPSARSRRPRRHFAWSADSFSTAAESQLVTLTNQARASAGLTALKVDSTLTLDRPLAQQGHDRPDYFSHAIPALTARSATSWTRRGYCYKVAGENIGWNNYPDDRDRRRSSRCSWARPATAPTSSARPGTASASAPTRSRTARRVDRPLRRQVRR